MIIQCPIDGCPYSNTSTHNLALHIMHKNRDDHPTDWQECLRLATEATTDQSDGESQTEPMPTKKDRKSHKNQPETPTQNGRESAIFEDPPDPDPVCPKCGGSNVFDASDHTDYKFGCEDCSTEDSWMVFNE